MRILAIFLLVGIATISGCSGVSPAQIGQTTGTIAGAALVPGVGAPFGALIGTLAGLVVEHELDKVREQKERVELSKELQTPAPAQSLREREPVSGQPTRVWVDEWLKDGQVIPGHFEVRTIS